MTVSVLDILAVFALVLAAVGLSVVLILLFADRPPAVRPIDASMIDEPTTPFQRGDLVRHNDSRELMRVEGVRVLGRQPRITLIVAWNDGEKWRHEEHDARDVELVREAPQGVK